MKPAREVARRLWDRGLDETPEYLRALTKAIKAARREGAEWMREQVAALIAEALDPPNSVSRGLQDAIRDLPVEPKP